VGTIQDVGVDEEEGIIRVKEEDKKGRSRGPGAVRVKMTQCPQCGRFDLELRECDGKLVFHETGGGVHECEHAEKGK
jgi:hypothetical protein